MNVRRVAIGFLLLLGATWLIADAASAAMVRPLWRQRQNYRAPAAAATPAVQQGI